MQDDSYYKRQEQEQRQQQYQAPHPYDGPPPDGEEKHRNRLGLFCLLMIGSVFLYLFLPMVLRILFPSSLVFLYLFRSALFLASSVMALLFGFRLRNPGLKAGSIALTLLLILVQVIYFVQSNPFAADPTT